MFLPMINNRNSKPSQQKFNLNDHNVPKEQFGLGIQVFKIQSTKAIDSNPTKQKKTTKNIENPIFQQPTVQTVKRTQMLPSLSVDKKARTGGLNDTFKERKATVEKKKLVLATDSIKEFDERHRPAEKKPSGVQQTSKAALIEQTSSVVNEKQIIQKHYKPSYNTLIDFYECFEDRQAENLKEIKRLRKAKENNGEEQLAYELRMRQNHIELVQDLVDRQALCHFQSIQQYDEFSLTNYTQSGCQFKYQDQEPTFQY